MFAPRKIDNAAQSLVYQFRPEFIKIYSSGFKVKLNPDAFLMNGKLSSENAKKKNIEEIEEVFSHYIIISIQNRSRKHPNILKLNTWKSS